MVRSKRAALCEIGATSSVVLVSRTKGTLDGLSSYLAQAGFVTRVARRIEGTAETARGASAIVLFPDDFDRKAVLTALTECRRRLPTALQILVTSSPEGFRSLEAPVAGPTPVLVAKPAWGWTILDAILAESNRRSPKHR
jgi:hypothetical protein